MPVYREGKDLYRVKVYWQGKPRSEMVHGSQKDAELVEARLRLEVRKPPPPASAPVPSVWNFLVDEFRPHVALRLSPSWRRNLNYTLATIDEHMGKEPLTAITTQRLEGYMAKRRAAGLVEISVNNELRIIKRVLAFAVERGHILAVPKCKPLPVPEQRVKCWTAAELERLMATCTAHAPRLLPMLMFLANTGCRRGEALALRWESVELERRIVRIEPGHGWRPKNRKAREVPVNDVLLPFLQLPRRGLYAFPSSQASRYATWPSRTYDDVQKAAGLAGGVHTLRHTYASHFLARRPDLTLLAYVMGHSDAEVTRLYAHMLPDHLERARDAVAFAAPPAAAEALAAIRWKPSGRPSGAKASKPKSLERATGFEPATSSLGNSDDRSNRLKLLRRDGR